VLDIQNQLPGCGGFAVTRMDRSAAALSCTAWSNRTTIGWPTPTADESGAGMNDG
jgi:hypothetical protein